MHTALPLVVVCFILASQAQAPVPTGASYMYTEYILGNAISFHIGEKELNSSPEWLNPESDPPPLAVAEAVRTSRSELNRYVPNPEEWQVTTVNLRRLDARAQWFYLVDWRLPKRGHVGDGVTIPVLMNGRAVIGEVRPDPDTKKRTQNH
jgi:hypothetical protein